MQRNIKKTNKILLILLVMQIALVVYVFRPIPQEGREGGLLLAGLAADQISAFTIIDNETQTITLEKHPAGWAIKPMTKELASLPADNGKVNILLEKIVALSRNRLVTRTKASHNRLKVGQLYNRKIEVKAGKDKQVLFLGSAPNYKSLHVRLDGEDEVYLAKDLSIWEAPTAKESWWRTEYVDLDPDELTGIELTNPNGQIMLKKGSEGLWQLEGLPAEKELNKISLESFLNDLAHLTILEYLPADFTPPVKETMTTLQLTTSEEVITLTVAPKDKEKEEYVIKSSQTAYFAKVGIHAVRDILEIRASDLSQSKKQEDSDVKQKSTPLPQ